MAAGHDVIRSIHALSKDAADEDILAFAVMDGRILITCDSDFGELIFLKGHAPSAAVIYVQFDPQDVEDIVPRVLSILAFDNLIGHMVVIGDTTDRMTLFPKRDLT